MASPLAESRIAALTRTLTAAANAGGGWPYFAGKASRVEPTCWALLALHGTWSGTAGAWADFAASHLRFLAAVQQPDGTFADVNHAPANIAAAALAAISLPDVGADAAAPIVPRVIEALIRLKGIAVDEPDPRQDNSLQAWSWYPGTFSWVEPTAWSLLALRKHGATSPSAIERVAVAERMLENRCCDGGGWNYGNASALGQDLRPYVSASATALLAVEPLRARPFVARSIAYLERARLHEPSGLALGLAALALRVFGKPASDVEERLADISATTERLGNLHSIAVALYALTADRHDARALRVAA